MRSAIRVSGAVMFTLLRATQVSMFFSGSHSELLSCSKSQTRSKEEAAIIE
jgi:hypothetical protein